MVLMKLHIPRSSMHIYENGTSISKKNSGHPLQYIKYSGFHKFSSFTEGQVK